jgi:aerobactin synthase
VAHGQNIVLIMKDYFPTGMILKDFHGDMRLSSELPVEGEKAFGSFKDRLTQLPRHYLIHDLITGSFITVHRFISLVMKESMNYPEENYYALMNQVLKDEPGSDILLRPEFEKLLLNKVRFKIGYGDSDERPLPILGGPLKNPIAHYKEISL